MAIAYTKKIRETRKKFEGVPIEGFKTNVDVKEVLFQEKTKDLIYVLLRYKERVKAHKVLKTDLFDRNFNPLEEFPKASFSVSVGTQAVVVGGGVNQKGGTRPAYYIFLDEK